MDFALAMQAAGGSVLQASSAPTKPPICVATSASLALYTWVDLPGPGLRVLCAFKSCSLVPLPMPITSSKQEVRPGVLKFSKCLRRTCVEMVWSHLCHDEGTPGDRYLSAAYS